MGESEKCIPLRKKLAYSLARISFFIVALLAGCSGSDEKSPLVEDSLQNSNIDSAELPMDIQTDSAGNPILNQFSEEGFVDLTFRIVDLKEDDEYYRFHLSASHNNRTVGMNVVLVKEIQGGLDSNLNLVKDHVYRSGVQFLRSGEDGDRLVAAICELYGAEIIPNGMVDQETFTAIALHQGRLDLGSETVKLKLFGKDGEPFDEKAYYESFFNVDLANGFVYWNEKDPDYRDPLLRALSHD